MVLLFVLLVISGLRGGDALQWHMRFGQALLALVLFRVLWGFVGSRNARFRAFVRGPRAAARYVRSRVRRTPEIHATHNPIGGWMVIALLVAMLVQIGAGLFTNDDILWDGPLAKHVSKETSDALASFHRRFAWVVVTLAALHVLAVVAYLTVFRENLVKAMVDGVKSLPADLADPSAASASSVRAMVLLAACGIAVWFVLHRLA
jgi:cytochrome b